MYVCGRGVVGLLLITNSGFQKGASVDRVIMSTRGLHGGFVVFHFTK